MITVDDICTALSAYSDMEGYSTEQLLPSCENGLRWVLRRLKDNVDENDPLITETAAALAHYYYFICRLADPEKYESYKIGDITIKHNPEKELKREKEMRKEAIVNAASILKDGGFFFSGN